MQLEIKRAVRRALPLQIAFYGPTGSGKTMSALLFAAGLAGPTGKIVVIDTERGRASIYSDNKKIVSALGDRSMLGGAPFDVLELESPYHPLRFIEAIDACEKAGYKVCLIDSASDEWDGPGGCSSIAEENKGRWNKPKLLNKKFMTRIALSDMHIICLLKAQEKSKIIDKAKSATGKEEVINLGILPICEKNFFYPQLLGFSVDPTTHISTAVKYHDDLAQFFDKPKLISKEDGDKVRVWNESGKALEDGEQLQKRARVAASEGMDEYTAFFNGLTPAERKALAATTHAENKRVAEQADKDRAAQASDDNPTEEQMREWDAKQAELVTK